MITCGTKPSYVTVKINVDVSFHGETLLGACGAVARDDRGDFIAAANCLLPHVHDVDSVEIIVICLFLATNLGCNTVEIESDCLLSCCGFSTFIE